jgi:hypothetical protein
MIPRIRSLKRRASRDLPSTPKSARLPFVIRLVVFRRATVSVLAVVM